MVTYYFYFEGDNRVVQLPAKLIYRSDGTAPEGFYNLQRAFGSVYGAQNVMPFQRNIRTSEVMRLTENVVFTEGAEIHFFPLVTGVSCLLAKYAAEDARLKVADMANRRGIKGTVARVAHEAAGHGQTALRLELYHQNEAVLHQFLAEVCNNGPDMPPAEIVGQAREIGYRSMQEHFVVKGGGPAREDNKVSAGSVGGYSLASPTAFHAMFS